MLRRNTQSIKARQRIQMEWHLWTDHQSQYRRNSYFDELEENIEKEMKADAVLYWNVSVAQ